MLPKAGWAASTQPAGDVRGTLVTIHANGACLPDVVADLARQAGTSIEVSPYYPEIMRSNGFGPQWLWPPVTLDLDHVPFWQALTELCDRADASVNRTETPKGGLTVSQGASLRVRRDIRGAIIMTAGPVQWHTNLLWVKCLWEPGLDVVIHDTWLTPTITTADDRSLVTQPWPPVDPKWQDVVQATGWGNGIGFGSLVPLTVPDGVKSARVRGTVQLWVAKGWEAVTVPYPGPDFQAPPAVLRMSDVRQITVMNVSSCVNPVINIDDPSIRIDVSRDGLSDADWLPYRHLVTAGRVTLKDAQGRPYFGPGETGGRDGRSLVNVAFNEANYDGHSSTVFHSYQKRPGEGPAATLSVCAPTGLTKIDVPYVLTDVPVSAVAVGPASEPVPVLPVTGH